MDERLEQLAEELWGNLTLFDFDSVSKCPIIPCKGSEYYKKKVASIQTAFKQVAREYWDKGYKAHALDVLAGDQVTPNPMEEN